MFGDGSGTVAHISKMLFFKIMLVQMLVKSIVGIIASFFVFCHDAGHAVFAAISPKVDCAKPDQKSRFLFENAPIVKRALFAMVEVLFKNNSVHLPVVDGIVGKGLFKYGIGLFLHRLKRDETVFEVAESVPDFVAHP